jgi:hypothetical protein
MNGITKNHVAMASAEFARLFNEISKQALIDSLWCACQLGTDESDGEILAQAARNAKIALHARGDRIPGDIISASKRVIDSD